VARILLVEQEEKKVVIDFGEFICSLIVFHPKDCAEDKVQCEAFLSFSSFCISLDLSVPSLTTLFRLEVIVFLQMKMKLFELNSLPMKSILK